MVFFKLFLAGVVCVLIALFVRLAVRTLECKVALCFEDGLSRHYPLVKGRWELDKEVLMFPYGEVGLSDICFLLICGLIRVAYPDVSLKDLRFRGVVVGQSKGDAGNVCPVWEGKRQSV